MPSDLAYSDITLVANKLEVLSYCLGITFQVNQAIRIILVIYRIVEFLDVLDLGALQRR